MAEKAIQLDVVSAECAIYSGMVSMVFAPAALGEMGIAPGHTPVLSSLQPGVLRAKNTSGEEEIIFVSGGIIEVQPYQIIVLSDTALRAKDIDEERAIAAREHARKLLDEKTTDLDYTQALAALTRAVARIRAIQQLRKDLR